jgi:hypothetical protein
MVVCKAPGVTGKSGELVLPKNIRSAAGIHGDCPSDAEVAPREGGGVESLAGGAQFGDERVGLYETTLKAGHIDVAGGIGLNGIDHVVGEIRQGGDRFRGVRDHQES